MSHTKNHPDSPNGQDDLSKNDSGNRGFADVLDARLARRSLIKGGFGLAATGFMGVGLSACGGDSVVVPIDTSFKLGFTAVAKNLNDVVTLPTGYTSNVLYRLGDPINSATAAYVNDGTDTADSFNFRAGDHHDGMSYFGLNSAGTAKDLSNSTRGLLVMNHENITQIFLHTNAEVGTGFNNTARVVSQIDKEVNAHGVSVIDVLRTSGNVSVNQLSGFNRRITAATVMDLKGPASGNPLLQTKYSTTGVQTRGTVNNCANGTTPWGTYLTCEENWAGYFKRPASANPATSKVQAAQNRYMGSGSSNGSYGWANPSVADTGGTDLYNRWDINPAGTNATDDFRNAANTFGWNVEIDPFAPASTPRKRTAMGRFGHEGAMLGKVTVGKPIVYYMGDDSEGEYMYKYVSTQNWLATDANGGLTAGDKYLDSGKLYVATYNDNGTGKWTELNTSTPAIAAGYTAYGFSYSFADQADILVNCRLAADAVGATPMDRPEWADVHPTTGDVYLTLTKNTNRGKSGIFTSGKSKELNSPNPRYYSDVKGVAPGTTTTGNVNGHIIRMKEAGSDPAALTFNWDIYLFGAQSDADSTNINISGLSADNDFSSPDGLWFSQAVPGLMWIQTDDGSYTDVTNCMMLAAMPGQYGDGGAAISVLNKAVPTNSGADQTVTTFAGKDATSSTLKRFLVGPKGCEITGIAETPDGKAIFVNIQHPGENTSSGSVSGNTPASFESHWPDNGTARPRSSTIVITKNDGGLIGS
jgi:secreted PhoX family phosphatase